MAEAYVPFWHKDPDSWDSVYLAGEICPGINAIEGLTGKKRKLDTKKGPGRDGVSIVDQGYDPATWTIVCLVTFEQELSSWQNLISLISPKGNEPPQALSIVHPQLALLGISSCYVTEISQLERKNYDQYTGKIKCLEFLPLKSAKGSGAGVKKKALDIRDAALPASAEVQAEPKGTGAVRQLPSANVKAPKP